MRNPKPLERKTLRMHKPTAAVITLGCKVNQYESEAAAERLEALGFSVVDAECGADVYIVNTCAVTAEAERKSRQLIRRCRRINPSAAVIVMGCASETAPREIAEIDGVFYVFGTANKLRAADAALEIVKSRAADSGGVRPAQIHVQKGAISNMREIEPMRITTAPRTRAYVKICDGCEGKCAYCIIPSLRGPVRSCRIDDILSEVNTLASGGVREVVFTGIETADFGRDTGESLIALLKAAALNEGLERIRLSSLEPTIFTPEFVDAVAGVPKIMPHFHISLQSGCDRTLHAMRRRYGVERAAASIELLREKIPDVMFSADMIVGFPGETDADFEETLGFVRKMRPLHLHVFPFSPRRGTAAEKMSGQVPESVKKERSSALIGLGESIRDDIISDYVSRRQNAWVLFEADEKDKAGAEEYHAGHTENFIEVYAKMTPRSVTGEILPVRLTHAENGIAYGDIC